MADDLRLIWQEEYEKARVSDAVNGEVLADTTYKDGMLYRKGKIWLPHCYTSGINTHKGTRKATPKALLRSLPHNGTQLYGITIEYVVSCTCYHHVHKCDS